VQRLPGYSEDEIIGKDFFTFFFSRPKTLLGWIRRLELHLPPVWARPTRLWMREKTAPVSAFRGRDPCTARKLEFCGFHFSYARRDRSMR